MHLASPTQDSPGTPLPIFSYKGDNGTWRKWKVPQPNQPATRGESLDDAGDAQAALAAVDHLMDIIN